MKIQDFELDDDNSEFTFSDRLARENVWTHDFALRAIEEYKRFMFLICISNKPLTPSDEVDQVWHLHLLYTRSYWKEFCADVLEREIHHGPTKGGIKENAKFNDWYTETLQVYKQKFNTEAPEDLWPPKEKRFTPGNFVRVNTFANWIIKKPFV
ncbi:hypothetical protein KK060_23735 [Fulvivirgaceae bacterium PWU20]|uniref:Uncharacterized protein n=2 Tax=Chryseosolibacter indicus TaxID=2782351 RepID=A0ABS5VYD0_9BACT|nr:hypothetical protein [Chryseosolibacter indicus]